MRRSIASTMASISRTKVLYAIIAGIALAALPGAVRRLIQTGDPYLFTERFFQDMLARLSGPGKVRFLVQPVVAIVLGARDGAKDARGGLAPFLWGLAFHGGSRRQMWHTALLSVRDLVAIAILLDLISQALIFHELHPGAALLLGPVLIAIPYSLARALANRIARKRTAAPAREPRLRPAK